MTIEQRLAKLSDEQRADLKANEWMSAWPLTREKRGRWDVQITQTQKISGGLSVFVRAWLDNVQVGFGADGSYEIERIRVFNPPMLVPDPHGPIVRDFIHEGVLYERRFREDAREALLQHVERTVQRVAVIGAKPTPGKTSRTVSTFSPNTSTGTGAIDGRVERRAVDESFATIRAGAGTTHADTDFVMSVGLRGSSTTNQFDRCHRSIVGFVTSSLPDTDVISSATLDLYGFSVDSDMGTVSVGVVAASPANPADLADSDYGISTFATGAEFATRINSNVITTSGYNTFTLNASGIAHISKTGNTIFGLLDGWTIDNSFGGSWSSLANSKVAFYTVDQTGTSQDPVLTVTHAAPVGGGPWYYNQQQAAVRAAMRVRDALVDFVRPMGQPRYAFANWGA